MHALCIPTTRALCMTGSEEEVYRERNSGVSSNIRTMFDCWT